MMKNISISNYKSLEELKISNLKRVNLFTGKNNTGKSTVLEAISLLTSRGNLNWIHYLLNSRGEINNYREEVISEELNKKILTALFSHRNENSPINIRTNENNLSLKFVKFIEERIFEKDDVSGEKIVVGRKRVVSDFDSDIEDFSIGFEIKTNENVDFIPLDRRLFRRSYPASFEKNFHFVNAKGDDYSDNSSLWDKITLSEKEEFVIKALKVIEPKITRLSFVGENIYRNERYPIVKLEETPHLYPLKAMGDGINRILNIILTLVNSDNGVLLIDEFENGLHYSVQEKLWEIIFEISNILNVQVFVTTHSNDSINSFAKVLSKRENYEGSLHRLVRKGEFIKSYEFNEEEIKEASRQNINLR